MTEDGNNYPKQNEMFSSARPQSHSKSSSATQLDYQLDAYECFYLLGFLKVAFNSRHIWCFGCW